MNIDYSQVITAEQQQATAHQAAIDEVLASRRAAYASVSDPLRLEADYDALVSGNLPDYTAWMAAVTAIKQQFPLPTGARE